MLQDLVSRGVHRVLPFVTEDCRGLREVIGKLFPCAQHRLCLLHLQRHLERGLLWEAMEPAGEALFRLRRSRDREEGGHRLGELAAAVARERPALARQSEAKAEGYLAFLDYPEEVRVHRCKHQPGGGPGCRHRPDAPCAGRILPLPALPGGGPVRPGGQPSAPVVAHTHPHRQGRKCKPRQLFALRYELAEEEVFLLHRV